MMVQTNRYPKDDGVAIVISNKTDIQKQVFKRDGERRLIINRGKIHHNDVSILNIYTSIMFSMFLIAE